MVLLRLLRCGMPFSPICVWPLSSYVHRSMPNGQRQTNDGKEHTNTTKWIDGQQFEVIKCKNWNKFQFYELMNKITNGNGWVVIAATTATTNGVEQWWCAQSKWMYKRWTKSVCKGQRDREKGKDSQETQMNEMDRQWLGVCRRAAIHDRRWNCAR